MLIPLASLRQHVSGKQRVVNRKDTQAHQRGTNIRQGLDHQLMGILITNNWCAKELAGGNQGSEAIEYLLTRHVVKLRSIDY